MDDNNSKYRHLYKIVCKAMPQISKQEQQKECNQLWNKIKSKEILFESVIDELSLKAVKNKSQLFSLWSRASESLATSKEKSHTEGITSTAAVSELQVENSLSVNILQSAPEVQRSIIAATEIPTDSSAETPQQSKLQGEISQFQEKVLALIHVRRAGLLTEHQREKFKKMESIIKLKRTKLKRLQSEALRQRRRRANMKRVLEDIVHEQPSLGTKLRKYTREKSGRPSVTEDQPDLLDAIINIASIGAAASDRRRSEQLRSCKTLDDLQKCLTELGFYISRSATYLRLLPKKSSTLEGKRHVKTVPVKLIRAANTARERHIDASFTFASMGYMDEICSIFGPGACFYLSQDDKAKVPLGLSAATKQAPILMHLDYTVRLPDHDFVVASRHKLIPSVYAACTISTDKFTDAVTYSGPTYIAIRSMKHDSSTAFTHGHDLERLMLIESFKTMMCTTDGTVKPIFVVASDGGPDENPRFPKPLQVASARFIAWDLDVYICGTHAPHYSVYNRVERRMAPLSRELAGLVLPHNYYGTHLNTSEKTIDLELEKNNFAKTAETLATVWSAVSIDNHDVHAEYIKPIESPVFPEQPNAEWVARHVRQSQYFLMIIKCDTPGCCRPWRSSWKKYFPKRFVPGPVVLSHAADGISIPDPDAARRIQKPYFRSLAQRIGYVNENVPMESPFDLYCPSLLNSCIQKRTCKVCGIYHASQASLKRHNNAHAQIAEDMDADSHDEEISSPDQVTSMHSGQIPVIGNLFDWVKSPFE